MNVSMRSSARNTRRGATWRSGTQQEVVVPEEVTQPPVISQPPPPPPPELDMDTMMESGDAMEIQDGTPERKKKPWERGGVKIKKKKVPGAKNLRIRKYVQPKNAVMCLNELQPGLTYVTEVGKGVSMPVCVSVEVNGQKYKGFGSSKGLAKQAAAEAALISFVKPPAETSDPSDDQTPWATLASFAIFKLFNEWREGRVGMMPTTSQAMNLAFPQADSQTSLQMTTPTPPATEGKVSESEGSDPTHPKPAKSLPDNASSIHPAVVLHQMRPNIQYNIEISNRNDQKFFIASTVIDGQQFTGEGLKVKKAKFQLAKQAIQILFQVESTFEIAA